MKHQRTKDKQINNITSCFHCFNFNYITDNRNDNIIREDPYFIYKSSYKQSPFLDNIKMDFVATFIVLITIYDRRTIYHKHPNATADPLDQKHIQPQWVKT